MYRRRDVLIGTGIAALGGCAPGPRRPAPRAPSLHAANGGRSALRPGTIEREAGDVICRRRAADPEVRSHITGTSDTIGSLLAA
jgi:hypothetical protein